MKTKITFLLLIWMSLTLTLSAQSNAKISVEFKETPLPTALKRLEQASGYRILFTYSDVENYQTSASIHDATITQAVEKILEGKPLSYQQKEKEYIIIFQKEVRRTPVSIRGTVINEKNEPMPYCNVLLLSSDSTFVNGCVTQTDGSFLMIGEEGASYSLRASYIGYATITQAIGNKNLIQLIPNNHLLEDVVVTGMQQPTIVQQAGKLIFNVENSISAQGTNAFEILKYTPGVTVNDGSRTISINGQHNILVMLNGKQTYMQPSEIVDLLKSTPSSNIKSIEVMTNATAQYDASGSGGILNIVMKRERGAGYNMTINTGLAYWQNLKQNTEVSFNYNHNKINLYGNYSHNFGYTNLYYGGERKQYGMLFESHSDDTDKRNTITASFGLDYEIAPNHQVGIQASGNFLFGPGDIYTSNQVYDSYEKKRLLYTLQSKSDYYHQTANRYHLNANYKYELPEERQLTLDLDYSKFLGDSRINQPNIYYSPTNAVDSTDDYRNLGKRNIRLYAVTSHYAQNLGKGKLSAGVKFSNVKSENSYRLINTTNGNEQTDINASNDFHYKESILSAYLMYDINVADKWTLNVGGRMEYTHSNGHLYPYIGSVQKKNKANRNYTDFFPSASITYQINDHQTLSLSYGKRIDRPVYSDLNPIDQPLDGLSSWKGNPFLEPQKTHRISLEYQYKRTSLGLSYSKTSDYFISVTDTLGPNKTVVMPLNLGSQQYYGLSLSQTLRLFNVMDINFSGRVYHLDNKLAFDQTRFYHRNRWAYGLMTQASFPLFWGIKSEILGIYSSKRLGGATDTLEPNYQVNIGFQKRFLNDRAIVKLSMSDIFWTSNWDSVNKFDGLESINYGYGETRLVRLNFTFKFGGNKKNYSKESKVESELNRF